MWVKIDNRERHYGIDLALPVREGYHLGDITSDTTASQPSVNSNPSSNNNMLLTDYFPHGDMCGDDQKDMEVKRKVVHRLQGN